MGINSHTQSGGGGATFSVEGRGLSGCDGGAEHFFFYRLGFPSSSIPYSDHLSTYLRLGVSPLFLLFFWIH